MMGEITAVATHQSQDVGGIKVQNEDELRLAQMGWFSLCHLLVWLG